MRGAPGTGSPDRVILAPLGEADLDEVVQIERDCFEMPWTRPMFAAELHKTIGRNYSARTSDGRMAGFLIAYAIADGGHLLNIAVRPEMRRSGIGRILLGYFIEVLRAEKMEAIYLEVRRSNAAAIELYKSFGLERIGTRYGYYENNGEDAIVMARKL